MTFEEYIVKKYPLYAQIEFNTINVSWGEVFRIYNEYLAHRPLDTVTIHSCNAEPKNTQDNHLKRIG